VSTADPSLAHLLGRLQVLEMRVRTAIHARRANDSNPDDRFRGLYISDEEIDALLTASRPQSTASDAADSILARVEGEADAAERDGADLRLRRLARSFELPECDLELLVVALAPDLEPRFERLYAYLHDDVSRRRASTGLALELTAGLTGAAEGRRRLHPNSPLIAGGLLLIEDADRPFLTRSLRPSDRVVAHLLGDDTADELVASVEATFTELDCLDVDEAVNALKLGQHLSYVRNRPGAAGYSFAATALFSAGLPHIDIDLQRVDTADDLSEIAGAAVREARLRGAGLVVGPIDAIADGSGGALRMFSEARCPVFLVGSRTWDPCWSRELPVLFDAPAPGHEGRMLLWRRVLDGSAPPGIDAAAATVQYRLAPEQVEQAVHVARRRAAAGERPLTLDDVQAAARGLNSSGLERLARRIEPRAGWDDLVLPPDIVSQLRELAARLRHRERVLDIWGLERASSRGRGITCLFAGDSGTGKTLSAEVVAGDLGLDLYVIDLSTVVDKYVGETEKNLDRVFAEADRVNGVLLFDEADALFGKRSEVKEARDRWANVEVAYLLQRMELFDGIAILTTNLRANVDDAFSRRLDGVVDFPLPDEKHRHDLWEKNLGRGVPVAADVDLEFLAASFKLSGGNIRNIVVTAAYLAADGSGAVGMPELVRAIEREYRKLGRLCVASEFGEYYPLVSALEVGAPL
jgi:Winged helix domain, variant/ATPase family associated with various cellular activities (AAA)